MKTYCHHCNRFGECSLVWEKKPDGKRDLILACEWCVFLYAYKFIAYVLGK